jgi:hypothetical protein
LNGLRTAENPSRHPATSWSPKSHRQEKAKL